MKSHSGFRYPKTLRLHNEKEISFLFNRHSSFLVFPVKVLFCEINQRDTPFSLLISVPKSRLRKAFHRNRIKRIIREAFRKNNALLSNKLKAENKQMLCALIYVHNTPLNYHQIELAVVEALGILEKKV